MPAEVVTAMIDVVRSGRPLCSLEAELQSMPLSVARKLGLNEAWVRRVEAA